MDDRVRPGNRRLYPWEEWFRARHMVLLRGAHYHCSQATMAQLVRNNASVRGHRVRVADTGSAIVFDIVGTNKRDIKVDDEVPHTITAPITE
jgi:hypothetical protein